MPARAYELIGSVIAQQAGLRLMSLSIARMVDQGGSPVAEAAMAKDLGTELEQLLVDQLWAYRYEAAEPAPAVTRFHEFLDINRLRSAVFTTAGGTNEVLRLLVSRQLGAWAATRKGWALRSPLARDGVRPGDPDRGRRVAAVGAPRAGRPRLEPSGRRADQGRLPRGRGCRERRW